MFRRLADMLFKEEEIVIEEEIDDHVGEVDIPELKPLEIKGKQSEIHSKESDVSRLNLKDAEKRAPISNDPEDVKTVMTQPQKKSRMIDVDDAPVKTVDLKTMKIKPMRVDDMQKPRPTYQPKEIISPMYGGPAISEEEKLEQAPSKTKKQPSKHDVISPMFGRVNEPTGKQVKEVDPSIMEFGVEDMLANESSGEEIQVSLYDYLEGLEDNENK